MPIYEYACESCGHTFDALQKIGEERLTECPECHRPELKKLVSAPVFRLKGNGWYETDFKTENRRNLADSGQPDSGKSQAGSKANGKGGAAGKKAKAKSGDKPAVTKGS